MSFKQNTNLMNKQLNLILLFIGISLFAFSQQGKKMLTHDDILKWNRITETLISNNGQTIVYKTEPWKGDPTLIISDKLGTELFTQKGGDGAAITENSAFVVFTIKAPEEKIHELKLKKTKKEEMPLPDLGIFSITDKKFEQIKKIKSFKVSEKEQAFLAYQIELEKDTSIKEKPKAKAEKKSLDLHLKDLNTKASFTYPAVSEYQFAEDGSVLSFISEGNANRFKPGLYCLDLTTKILDTLFIGKADFKQLAISKNGQKIAFLADTNLSQKADKNYGLYYWKKGDDEALLIANNENSAIPDKWEISLNGKISFAPTKDRVFFGIAPVKAKQDTTILAEDIPMLDIWHWNEDELQTEQIFKKDRDSKKTYLCVYHSENSELVQLENNNFTGISLSKLGDGNQLIAWSNKPYAMQTMWEGSPEHNDFYLIDIRTGQSSLILKDIRSTPQISPEGKFVFWYNAMDTTWNTYHIEKQKFAKITTSGTVQCADEENDIPNPPSSYRFAGWLKNDEAILIYDRYDIWKVDPENKLPSLKLTKNGRTEKIIYRLIRFDLDGNNPRTRFVQANEKGIDPSVTAFLSGHNEITRQDGYYTSSLIKVQLPDKLFSGSFSLNTPIKSKNAEVYVFTKENFETFPNLLITDFNFKKVKQISNVSPQQADFNWGTAELVTWTSLDGLKLEGTLHKPADFDPNKKYPMIVNFYEKNSQELFSYRMPELHRSTIDYHYYTSNGYLVFNPDIYYKTGYPGQDAFNCIMPGITALIQKGFVNEKKIGAQGHSWGGYQVAYLATRTNLFAAIESGAPVVNMFSAYGGIRWGSGMSRSFQYEHTQSRIGKSIWESPLRYLENSPIFTMDKVNTPILIMHNDDDGAVPWYQGIEYFVALRRLGKPAWLLNYNEADHWPLKIRDKHDFQIRMAQFFDHFLKDKPMPKWMEEGIPAVDKGLEMGYELVEK